MASSTDFLLALENVSVSFDGFKAVNELNLYVDKGEMRVIIGPNGAGKTTVLDLICGRTKVSDGSIKFKNQEITGGKQRAVVGKAQRGVYRARPLGGANDFPGGAARPPRRDAQPRAEAVARDRHA